MKLVNALAFGLTLLAAPARAENSGTADPALLLGAVRTFAAEDAARQACGQDAAAGNYWDTDPRSSMTGHPGRSFPFTPIFVGS